MEGFTKLFLLVMLVSVTMTTGVRGGRRRTIRFGNFDDYLLSVVRQTTRAPNQDLRPNSTKTPSPESPTEEAPDSVDDADETDSEDGGTSRRVEDRDILGYFRDVPKRHWSCCMLGILAGDKGFHCHVQFYAAKIARNNINRAHSRKMMFHGPDAMDNWGRDIMTTFNRCVTREVGEFHRCCRTATDEARERQRWQRYRQITD